MNAADSASNFWGTTTESVFGLYSSQGAVINPYPAPTPNGSPSEFAGLDKAGNVYFAQGNTPNVGPTGCYYSGDVVLYEYAAGSQAASSPIRTLDLGQQCRLAGVTFDRQGTLYIGEEQWMLMGGLAKATIAVYPPGASGSDKPARVLTLPVFGSYNGINEVLTDPSGNLFVTCCGGLFKYAGGHAPRQRVLPKNVIVGGFAFDSHDNMFALIVNLYHGKNPQITFTTSLDEFSQGSSTPKRVIAGYKTELGYWSSQPQSSVAVTP